MIKRVICLCMAALLIAGTSCVFTNWLSRPDEPQQQALTAQPAPGPVAPAPEPPPQSNDAEPKELRPAEWATPMQLPGCPNLHKVSDDLYRGAQPSKEGMKQLKRLGIKTIINLRSFHSDRDEMGALKFNYVHIHAKAWHPEDEDVIPFLRTVARKTSSPVFVHCQYGADRTGMMMAVYRIVMQGWTREAAVDEMTNGGYGYHAMWNKLVEYVNTFDADKLKKAAGLAP